MLFKATKFVEICCSSNGKQAEGKESQIRHVDHSLKKFCYKKKKEKMGCAGFREVDSVC